MADLPGLIEGAAEGAGLGHRFLGHAERCKAILHLIDGTAENALENYKIINEELKKYNPELYKKPTLVVISKADSITLEVKKIASSFKKAKVHPAFLSAVPKLAWMKCVLVLKKINQRLLHSVNFYVMLALASQGSAFHRNSTCPKNHRLN